MKFLSGTLLFIANVAVEICSNVYKGAGMGVGAYLGLKAFGFI